MSPLEFTKLMQRLGEASDLPLKTSFRVLGTELETVWVVKVDDVNDKPHKVPSFLTGRGSTPEEACDRAYKRAEQACRLHGLLLSINESELTCCGSGEGCSAVQAVRGMGPLGVFGQALCQDCLFGLTGDCDASLVVEHEGTCRGYTLDDYDGSAGVESKGDK